MIGAPSERLFVLVETSTFHSSGFLQFLFVIASSTETPTQSSVVAFFSPRIATVTSFSCCNTAKVSRTPRAIDEKKERFQHRKRSKKAKSKNVSELAGEWEHAKKRDFLCGFASNDEISRSTACEIWSSG